jgi:hypothetical protein
MSLAKVFERKQIAYSNLRKASIPLGDLAFSK